MRRKSLLILITLIVVTAVPVRARAQALGTGPIHAGAKEEQVPVTKLVLRPAGEPRQALKYRLLPNLIDQKSGNAAVLYNKCLLSLAQQSDWKEDQNKICELRDLPLDEMPLNEAEKLLERYRAILEQFALAAVRNHCDWEISMGEQDPISLLLPEVQAMRGLLRLVALQAHVQIAQGRLDEAIRTLQTGYAMGRHAAEGPTLIHGLVGIALCGMMSEEVELLIQQPDAPNLYWALTPLPRPLVDMRPGIESEMNLLYHAFPELREIDDKRHGKAYWQSFSYRLAHRLSKWADLGLPDEPWKYQVMMAGLAIHGYPKARQALIDQGRPAAEVDAMPVPQVVAIYTFDTYNELRDDQFKWLMVPYHEAREHAKKSEQRLHEAGKREIVPLASFLLPALNAVNHAVARNGRTIAVLRTIEAIRMDVADHDGRLPDSLADINGVPIPLDPLTGKPFLYEKKGDVVVLKTPPPREGRDKRAARHFEIRFEKTP